MNDNVKKTMEIQGSVAPGFEAVRILFEKEMKTKAEHKAQLCVYHKGEQVVDLWAAANTDTEFSPDAIVNIFSSGKSLECLAIGSLVDKGLLSYEDKISKHWPEFAQKGKEDITVADLMRHEAGLMDFKKTLAPEDFLAENLKQNAVGSIIENVKVKIPKNPKFRRNYHAMTRGWVVNEVFRRVDPQGRTMGEYLREDVAGPLGADVNVGVKEEDLGKRAKIRGLNVGYHIMQSFVPGFMGRKVERSIGGMFALFTPIVLQANTAIRASRKKQRARIRSGEAQKRPAGSVPNRRAPMPGMNIAEREKMLNFFNQDIISRGESSSFNATCSARGLAKVAAMMAAGGTFEGKEYFSKDAWDAIHGEIKSLRLGGLVYTHFSQGGLNHFTMEDSPNKAGDRALNKGREGFFGWMGLGGSIFQWNPEEDIGFAFVPTSMHIVDIFNERGKVYQSEVARCVKRLAAPEKELEAAQGQQASN